MGQKVLIVRADHNDADYVTEETTVGPEGIALAKKVAAELKKNPHHNWCTSEYASENPPESMYDDVLTQEEVEEFNDMVPHGEYGVHTIESIEVVEVIEKIL